MENQASKSVWVSGSEPEWHIHQQQDTSIYVISLDEAAIYLPEVMILCLIMKAPGTVNRLTSGIPKQ